MRVGIIGAGINGLMIANTLATEKNIDITIFEKKKALSGTSSSSTKLLHGGIRYLENGDFKTVFQSLQDRSWWYENAPEFCWPIRINIPFTKKNFFSFCKYSLGIFMYNILPKRKIMNGNNLPDINLDELKTSFVLNASFYDLQMDECRLGNWVKNKCLKRGVKIFEDEKVVSLTCAGTITTDKRKYKFDRIINATGPWASKLLTDSKICSKFDLKLVAGSHILVEKKINNSYLLPNYDDNRVVFVIDYLGKTLIGTTEVEVKPEEINELAISSEEIEYLLKVHNTYMIDKLTYDDISSSFTGVRPLIKSKEKQLNNISREYQIEVKENLINVFGGKWTSAVSLSQKVKEKVLV